MRRRHITSVFAGISLFALSGMAQADVTHTVARGHTLGAIAARYHVTVKQIVDANHLRDPNHLKAGDTLTIPGVKPAGTPPGAAGAHGAPAAPAHAITYAARAKTPGVIHVKRLATSEDFTLRVADRRGRIPPTTAKTVEHMLRYPNNLSHPIEPRLIALLGVVSNHFGSRKIEVISGFRPYSPTQYTAHSNHNSGKAIDFRVVGVPNEALRDYCRTLHNVGVGFYPNSTFVHMDARTTPAFWIDFSKPGEPPRYNAPNLDADEGTSDVSNEAHSANPNEPSDPAAMTATPPDGTPQETPATPTQATPQPPAQATPVTP